MDTKGRRQSKNVVPDSPTTYGSGNSSLYKTAQRKNNERWCANDKEVASKRSTGMAADVGGNAIAGAAYRDRTSDRTRSEPLRDASVWGSPIIVKEGIPTSDGVTKDDLK